MTAATTIGWHRNGPRCDFCLLHGSAAVISLFCFFIAMGIKKYRIIERARNGMEDMKFHGRTGNSEMGQRDGMGGMGS